MASKVLIKASNNSVEKSLEKNNANVWVIGKSFNQSNKIGQK
jgi:hypothetical protein